MLREARIVVAKTDDASSPSTHARVRSQLHGAFKDFLAFHVYAAVVYDVSIEADRDASWDKLFQIAMEAGIALKQDSVYIRYPDGSVEIAKVPPAGGVTWSERYATERASEAPSGAVGAPGLQPGAFNAPPASLGAKRLPQIGEIWRNGVNQLVAVSRTATTIDGGYIAVTLTQGDSGKAGVGTTYIVDLNGFVLPDQSSHPRDLKTYVTRFDQA